MSVEVHAEHVRVPLARGRHADFHLRWLRHNCDADRHPATGERLIDSAHLPDVLAVHEAAIEDGVLRIRWLHEERVSRYPLAWLERHAYAIDRVAVAPPPTDVRALEVEGRAGPTSAVVEAALARVAARGAVLIRRETAAAEAETEAWIRAFGDAGLRLIATHFGRIEDLRTDNTTNANTDQLGYTDAAIDLHTDQPFLDHPPRYQLLQGIRSADRGGDSVLADAKAGFRYLASLDVEAADLLRRTPVRFHRQQKQFEREVVSPIVVEDGDRFQIRSSYFTIAPFDVPFDRMTAWYRAYDRLHRILHRHAYRFTIRPGDVLLYDNHRMVHGRTAFSGPRWVRGVYFDGTDAGFDRSG